MSDSLNIYQRLNQIRSKVAYVKKDKKVENYSAVTFDGIVAETREWFIEFGVMILPSLTNETMVDTGNKSQKGNPLYRYESVFAVRFVNCDDPSDLIIIEVPAHANDYGDKAPGKAITYATKSAVLKVLYLETGENDEARVTLNMAPGDEIQSEELEAMLKAIAGSESMEKLLENFAAAHARAEKDRDAKDRIIQAKNARQIVLKGKEKLGGAK